MKPGLHKKLRIFILLLTSVLAFGTFFALIPPQQVQAGWTCCDANPDGSANGNNCSGCGSQIQGSGCGGSCGCGRANTSCCLPSDHCGCNPNSWGGCSKPCGGGTQTNDCGETASCNTQSCCTPTNPGAFDLASPANGSILTNNSTTLTWTDSTGWGTNCAGSHAYNIYLTLPSADPALNCATAAYTLNSSTTEGTLSKALSNLSWSSTYCWYVVKNNGSNSVASNQKFKFSTNHTPVEKLHGFTQKNTCTSANLVGRADSIAVGEVENPVTYSMSFTDAESDTFVSAYLILVPMSGVNADSNLTDSFSTLAQKSIASGAIGVYISPGNAATTLNNSFNWGSKVTSGSQTNQAGSVTLLDIGGTGDPANPGTTFKTFGNEVDATFEMRFENALPTASYYVFASVQTRLSDGTIVSAYADPVLGSNVLKRLDTVSYAGVPPNVSLTGPVYRNDGSNTFDVTWAISQALGGPLLKAGYKYIYSDTAGSQLQDNTAGVIINPGTVAPKYGDPTDPNVENGVLGAHNYKTIGNPGQLGYVLMEKDVACNVAVTTLGVQEPQAWLMSYKGNISANNGYQISIPNNPTFTVPFTGTRVPVGTITIPALGSTSLDSGLAEYYALDETSGTTASDTSGHGKTATLVNGPVWTAAKYNNGLALDGSNDYLDMGNLGIVAPATFSLWFNSKTTGSDTRILSQLSGATNQSGAMRLDSGAIDLWNGSSWLRVIPASTISAGNWYNLVFTFNASNSYAVYLNGSLKSSGGPAGFNFSGISAAIGAKFLQTYGTTFSGVVDDVRVYNRILTSTEITQLATFTPATKTVENNGLVAWWKMDDNVKGDGQTLTDSSGNGLDATTHSLSWSPHMDCTVAGKFGNACDFNGVGDQIDLKSTIQFDSSDFSITGWFKTSSDTTGIYDQIWNSGYNAGRPDMEIGLTNNKLFFYARDASTESYLQTSAAMNDNAWHFFVAKRSSNNFSLQIDNSLTTTNVVALGDIDAAGVIPRIGNGLSLISNRYYTGMLDDIRVYDKALTSTEMTDIYNNSSVGVVGGDTGTPYLSTFEAISGNLTIPTFRISKIQTYALNYNNEAVNPTSTSGFTTWYPLILDRVKRNGDTILTSPLGLNNINQSFSSFITTATGTPVAPGAKVVFSVSGTLAVGPGNWCDIKGIILVNGNLTLFPDIINANSSSGCVYIVSGNVTVMDPGVKSPLIPITSPSQPNYDQINAYIITDGTLNTSTNNTGSGNKFEGLYINGGVIAKALNLHRDLNFAANLTDPGIVIKYDPGYRVMFGGDLESRVYSLRETL